MPGREGGSAGGQVGVIIMAYGTPRTPDDVEPYYTHIRRGRPPTPEQLADLQQRYNALGGVSPLAQRTEAQRLAIEGALEERAPGRFRVVLGQKHAAPFIEDAVDGLAADGVSHTIGLVLAPHFSGFSVGQYHERASAAADTYGLLHVGIDHWHLEPAYLSFLTAAVREAQAALPERHKVVFTAHSLPERVLVGDPYPDELRESAAVVAGRLGLNRWAGWSVAWQSAGATPDPWRGPDIRDVIRDLGATGRSDGVLVCAQGFTSDHLEVLYDLDIQARDVAAEAGLAFARTRSLNDDPMVMEALAERIMAADAASTP